MECYKMKKGRKGKFTVKKKKGPQTELRLNNECAMASHETKKF